MTTTNLPARRAASSPAYYHQPVSRATRVAGARRTGIGVRLFLGLVGLAVVVVLFAGLMLGMSSA